MKRGTKLLILAAVLAVACLAVWIVTEVTAPEPLPMSTKSGETIMTVDAASVTNINWTFGAEKFDFDYDGSSWTCKVQEGYKPDTAKMAKILVELSDIRADKIIETPEDLNVYGLNDPTCVVTVGQLVLTFGNGSSFNDTYYMSMGDGKVYMVSDTLYNCFAYTRNELVQMETIPDMTDVTAVTVENKNGTTALEKVADNDYTYSGNYVWFIKDDRSPISQDVVAGILMYLEDMEWLECSDAQAADLAAYGLDAPLVKCTTTGADSSFTFLIGSKNDKGYYACIEGSKQVYTVDSTTAEIFDAINPGMVACTDVLKMDWTTVTSVEVTMEGQTTVLTAGENGTWTLDGETTDAATVLEAINLMVAEAGEDLAVEGLTTELKLVFNRNTESFKQVSLTFYRHDGTNCIMQLDGNAPMLVLRDDVVALKEAFNTLFLG